jgi:hypothetical protein
LARRKGKKERVTPEFGERKEEKKSIPKFRALHCRRWSKKGSPEVDANVGDMFEDVPV